jgi:hypothetical protein
MGDGSLVQKPDDSKSRRSRFTQGKQFFVKPANLPRAINEVDLESVGPSTTVTCTMPEPNLYVIKGSWYCRKCDFSVA